MPRQPANLSSDCPGTDCHDVVQSEQPANTPPPNVDVYEWDASFVGNYDAIELNSFGQLPIINNIDFTKSDETSTVPFTVTEDTPPWMAIGSAPMLSTPDCACSR